MSKEFEWKRVESSARKRWKRERKSERLGWRWR